MDETKLGIILDFINEAIRETLLDEEQGKELKEYAEYYIKNYKI